MSKTAYYNGIIYTADLSNPVAEAFVVENGQFVYVGKNSDIPECMEKIDLKGACVLPGLIDSHCHMFAGVHKAASHMLPLPYDTRPDELGAVLLSLVAAKQLPKRMTVCGIGIDSSSGTFSASNLDSAFPNRPVLIFSFDGHALLLNSCAMKQLGICKETADPSDSSYYVRDNNGEPTGLVIEIEAMRPCQALIAQPTPEERAAILKQLALEFSALGYTAVFEAMSVDNEQNDNLKSLQRLDDAGELPLRISTSFGYFGEDKLPLKSVIALMRQNEEMYFSKNVHHNTLKIITDGTVEEHSALLYEPYCDDASNCGSEMLPKEEMETAARLAASEGFSVHIHAIGDKAVTHALDTLCAIEGCAGTKTIAHNELYCCEDIVRISDAKDIFFQTTPHWMTHHPYTLQVLGEQRYGRLFPIGTMQKNGVKVTFGSDSCLEPVTANPFLGMYYACARGTSDDADCLPPLSEGITRMESLLAYTINSAEQLQLENETGSISAGKSADYIVIDRDFMHCSLAELKEIRVLQTWFRGRIVKAVSRC